VAKTVQLSDDAYATLAALKREGESFSDTVKRLAGERKDILALRKLRQVKRDPGWDPRAFHEESARIDRKRLSERLGIKLRDMDGEE
jgi:Putative antitoxin